MFTLQDVSSNTFFGCKTPDYILVMFPFVHFRKKYALPITYLYCISRRFISIGRSFAGSRYRGLLLAVGISWFCWLLQFSCRKFSFLAVSIFYQAPTYRYLHRYYLGNSLPLHRDQSNSTIRNINLLKFRIIIVTTFPRRIAK